MAFSVVDRQNKNVSHKDTVLLSATDESRFSTSVNSPGIYEDATKGELDKLREPGTSRNLDQDPKLKTLMVSLLAGSDVMYAFAALRKYANANEALPDGDPNKIRINQVQLILTQTHAKLVKEKRDIHRYLQYEVTGRDIQRFIALNKELVDTIPNDQVNTQVGAIDNINAILKRLKHIDFGVREFDDQFAERQLVYGITVNRTNKRITVFFRGSVQDSRDWPTNLNILLKTLEVPAEFTGEKTNQKIKVHRGFHSYLNEKLDKETGRRRQPLTKLLDAVLPDEKEIRTKFTEINDNLQHILSKDEFKDYKVYVSGHSLGGALSQLLAYQLAGNNSLREFRNALPVTAITYASPRVGDDGFRQAFERLESMDILRHIRVSNAGDVVPVAPPGFGYAQTGVNFHVKKNSPMGVGYQRNHETIGSQISYAWENRSGIFKLIDDMADHHTPSEYHNNLMDPLNQELLEAMSVEDLYNEIAKN